MATGRAARRDDPSLRVSGGGDLLSGGCVVDACAEAVDRRRAAKPVMRTLPVVEVLPLREALIEFGVDEVGCRPELLKGRALHALDLAVEMWRARPDGTELDTS